MKKMDLVSMAKGNLVRRRLRTSLTVMGIVIGSLSILVMISLGLGLKSSISKEFQALGSTKIIQVYGGSSQATTGRYADNQDSASLKPYDVEVLGTIEGVTAVIPTLSEYITVTSGKYTGNATLVGIDPAKAEALGLAVAKGSLFDGESANEALFGSRVLESMSSGNSNSEMFFDDYWMGEEQTGEKSYNVDIFEDRLRIKLDSQGDGAYVYYPIIGKGILKQGDYATESNIYVPINTVRKMIQSSKGDYKPSSKDIYGTIYVVVDDITKVSRVTNEITTQGYSAYSNQQMLESINSSMQVIQIVLGALGGISLFVAAIGITNTMVMAVTERKKEIGVMKVIGATIQDIKEMFLLESAMIGAVGGILGVGLSLGIAKLMSTPAIAGIIGESMGGGESSFAFPIPLWLIGAGLIFTTLIGILSGYLPAKQAMNSSALDALRND